VSLDDHLSELEQDGYTIIPAALSPEDVDASRHAVQELLDAEDAVAHTTGTQTDNLRNAHAIVGKHSHVYGFFLNPPVM
jgi:hypothetical protein